tara:strand:+ start:1371 stop:1517 length:147 start_codon:yes stop_codon:yes gene_type:complete
MVRIEVIIKKEVEIDMADLWESGKCLKEYVMDDVTADIEDCDTECNEV